MRRTSKPLMPGRRTSSSIRSTSSRLQDRQRRLAARDPQHAVLALEDRRRACRASLRRRRRSGRFWAYELMHSGRKRGYCRQAVDTVASRSIRYECLVTLHWLLTVAARPAGRIAALGPRRGVWRKRLERLTESYWELRYEHGQLRARVNRAGSGKSRTAAERQPRTPASNVTAFVRSRSLKRRALNDYDVIVIGAGTGGYVAAIRAAQLGLKDRRRRETESARRHLPELWAAFRPRRCSSMRTRSRSIKGAKEWGVARRSASPTLDMHAGSHPEGSHRQRTDQGRRVPVQERTKSTGLRGRRG